MTMKLTYGVAALLLTGSLAACGGADGGGGSQREQYADGGTFTSPMPSDPGNLHPLTALQPTTNTVRTFAYDSMINVDADGQVVPQLASSWETTPSSVTFTLTEGVTCADGTEVVPSVAAKTFDWMQDPDNGSTLIGTNLPGPEFEVTADDDAGTLTITLPDPYGFLLEGAGLVPIVCPDGLTDPKSLAQATDGTGPFVLTDYVADDHLTMEVREDYAWGPDGATTDVPGFPSEVVFRIVADPTTAVNLFLAGELSEVTPSGLESARLEDREAFTVEMASGPFDLFYNQRADHPGADLEVRRALTTALDLDQLADVITEGDGERAEALALLRPRPCAEATVEGHLPEHDEAEAASILDEAGWTVGDDGVRDKDGERLEVTVSYVSGDAPTEAGMELVAQWWRDLGVDVTLKGQGAAAAIETLFAGADWDVAFLNVQIAYPSDFVAFAAGPEPDVGQNFAAISNDDYARLSAEAAETTVDAGACDLWATAEQSLFDNLDVVPVSSPVVTSYADKAEFDEGVTSPIEPTSIRLFTE
jgi:peptide/nickel transport system substrate-binding protein